MATMVVRACSPVVLGCAGMPGCKAQVGLGQNSSSYRVIGQHECTASGVTSADSYAASPIYFDVMYHTLGAHGAKTMLCQHPRKTKAQTELCPKL